MRPPGRELDEGRSTGPREENNLSWEECERGADNANEEQS